jgi:uncharacterized repeat protein (TIGR01451 family)
VSNLFRVFVSWVSVALATLAVGLLAPRPLRAQDCGRPCAKPSFGPAATYGAGASPASVAVADFSGDGKLDLATANNGSNNISILLGNGDGTFGAAVSAGAGTNPTSVAAGDFNGDGKPDLAVANDGSNNISILLGNGDGTFGAATAFAAGINPASVAVADFDGNGKLDVVVANTGSNNVTILLGNGDGTFTAAVNYGVGNAPRSVVAADVNGDGDVDLAVANAGSNNVSILLGNGDGTFGSATNYAVQAGPYSIAAGDLNGDGRSDLAVANGANAMVSVLLGNGDGTFGAAANHGQPGGAWHVAMADFNGDAKVDLAVANPFSDSVSIWLGNGDGTIQPPVTYGAGIVPTFVVVGSFNGDGKVDLAVANPNVNGVSIILNTNCLARRIRLYRDVSSCNASGAPFGTQPIVAVLDDGGNLVACDTNDVVASIEPGTGTPGASLGGDTTVGAVAGFAAYTNLSVDLAGRGYRLRFTHPAGTALSRTFTQGLADPTIAGPVAIGAGVAATYDAGPGYDTYAWYLDGRPIALTRTVTLSFASGTHTLQVSVTQDGCGPVIGAITINVVGGLACTTVLPGMRDGTFEAGPPWPAWTTQYSAYYGTPLCTPGLCGTGSGTAGPRSGSSWAWFGGSPPGEIAIIAQSAVLPAVPDLRLRFWMWIGYVYPPFNDLLYVTVDGSGVQAYQEPSGRENGYTQRDVSLISYANGAPHQIGYYYTGGQGGPSNFSVDDVQLVSCPVPAASINDVSIVEGNAGTRNAVFTISLSFPSEQTVTVDYQVTPGTAFPSGTPDYDPSGLPGYVHFPPGTTTATVSVPVYGDTTVEPDETFFVDLTNAFLATILRARGTATIVNDDGPDLSITKTDGQATATPGQPVTYTIVAANAAGPDAEAVSGATVTDVVPASLTSVTWTCVAAGGGTCTASGSGNIYDTVDLPVGATATYTLSGTVSANPTALRNTASVGVPAGMVDANPADNTATDDDILLCFGETVVVPDGRLTVSSIDAAATAWFGSSLRIGNSYSVEFKNAAGSGTPPGSLTVFSGDDACSGATTLATTDTSAIDPAGGADTVRVRFIATGDQGFFRMKLANASGSPITYTFGVSDTTMFSPAWSTNGSFDTFYSFLNTTRVPLSGTLTLLDVTGAELSTFSLAIPAGQTASTNTASLGVLRNRTGTARFIHDGPPGAVLAEAAIANFSISPAYVQPVKLQAVREAR